MEEDFEGRIDVIMEEKDNKQWIIVKDNGIGMSMQTIKDYLLNFAASEWFDRALRVHSQVVLCVLYLYSFYDTILSL